MMSKYQKIKKERKFREIKIELFWLFMIIIMFVILFCFYQTQENKIKKVYCLELQNQKEHYDSFFSTPQEKETCQSVGIKL